MQAVLLNMLSMWYSETSKCIDCFALMCGSTVQTLKLKTVLSTKSPASFMISDFDWFLPGYNLTSHTPGAHLYDSLWVWINRKGGTLSNPNKQLSGDRECLSLTPRYCPFNTHVFQSRRRIIELHPDTLSRDGLEDQSHQFGIILKASWEFQSSGAIKKTFVPDQFLKPIVHWKVRALAVLLWIFFQIVS